MEIPKEYQQLCKDIGKVLKKFNEDHGFISRGADKEKIIYRFSGQISVSDRKMSYINLIWDNGRHGDSSGKISISSTVRVKTSIEDND